METSLLLPPEAEHTKGIYARITSEIALNNANLVGIWYCAPEAILLVKEEDSIKVHEALQRMLSEAPLARASSTYPPGQSRVIEILLHRIPRRYRRCG